MSARWLLWAAMAGVLFAIGVSIAVWIGNPVMVFCVGSLFGMGCAIFSYEMQGSRWYP
jgi:hypothetical protein